MRKRMNSLFCVAVWGVSAVYSPLILAEEAVTPNQVVTALETTFHVHPGERRNHIKGTCAAGMFVGEQSAQQYSRSKLFSGEPILVVARFSLPGGNPNIPDTAKTPRGLALEFSLADDQLHHITMLNTPIFGAATPQTFFDHIQAKQPDPKTGKPDPDKIKQFKATHPDSHAQAEFVSGHNPPASWAKSQYFGIHTFKFINADANVTPVRLKFVPQDGEQALTDQELQSLPKDFLEARLIARTQQGPVRWDMIATIGQDGDPENDPTLAWSEQRQQLKLGTLTINSASPQQGAECENINFDPLVMADGIEPTDDPVLLFRSPAYAISFAKRLSGQ